MRLRLEQSPNHEIIHQRHNLIEHTVSLPQNDIIVFLFVLCVEDKKGKKNRETDHSSCCCCWLSSSTSKYFPNIKRKRKGNHNMYIHILYLWMDGIFRISMSSSVLLPKTNKRARDSNKRNTCRCCSCWVGNSIVDLARSEQSSWPSQISPVVYLHI